MESYKEYPIRCKTCNEQIACHAQDYENLLGTGISSEEALNLLGITEWCSRIAMMDPPIIFFNMENRDAIEGFKSVENVDEPGVEIENRGHAVFGQCIGTRLQRDQTTVIPLVNIQTKLTVPPSPVIQGAGRIPTVPVIGKPITGVPNIQTAVRPLSGIQQPQALVKPIISGIEIGQEIEAIGQGITVVAPEELVFKEPMFVGVPTINHDPTIPQSTIYVGPGSGPTKQSLATVLNGRTYLAR